MKKIELSKAETSLLIYVQNHQQAIFSGLLSTIAIDKHKIAVDDKTQFKLNADLTEMEISKIDDGENAIKAAK